MRTPCGWLQESRLQVNEPQVHAGGYGLQLPFWRWWLGIVALSLHQSTFDQAGKTMLTTLKEGDS
jgi:hypothetical protein